MSKQRDAIQILLDLEQKIDTLTKISINNDMLLKALLNQSNQISPVSIKKEINPNSIKIEAALPENLPQQNNQQLPNRSHKRIEYTMPVQTKEQIVVDKPIQQEQKVFFEEVDVNQKVMLPGKKDAFMCIVTVLSLDNSTSYKTKTNAVGKYTVKLKPGKYRITLEKTTATKEQYKVVQEINVDGKSQKMDLQEVIFG